MAEQVFLPPELVEIILLQLPMKDLLLSQRVCKTWKAVVESSSGIQKALFFTAGNQQTTVAADRPKTNAYIGYPCICYSCTKTRTSKTLNPLLFTSIRDDGRVTGLELLVDKDLHPQASCRRMLLSQPPQDKITICCNIHGSMVRAKAHSHSQRARGSAELYMTI
ncbi:hypothetical protein LTR15_010397 [Elasticomyces elasticus]|nr:hypothetical protein LTR15_010397 [Elasticomyces elasticus]